MLTQHRTGRPCITIQGRPVFSRSSSLSRSRQRDRRQPTSIRLEDTLKAALRLIAEKHRWTLAELIYYALCDYVKKNKVRQPRQKKQPVLEGEQQ